MTRNIIKTATTSAALVLALGTTAAFAGTPNADFAKFDADANGQVTFEEYSAVATVSGGLNATEARAQFDALADGSEYFTEADLDTYAATMDSESDTDLLEPSIISEPNTEVLDTPPAVRTPELEMDDTDAESWEDTPEDLDTDVEIESEGEITSEIETPDAPEVPE